MAVDMFIKIQDIDGESLDDKHKNWIDVLSWSWGMENPGRAAGDGGRGGGGRVNIQDVSFSHPLDKSSPDLMLYCCTGKHIEEATLTLRKAGGEQREDYYIITMEKVLVTSVSVGGVAGEEEPKENVTLNFAKVKVKYVEQDAKGGSGGIHEFGWDLAKNRPF